MIDLPFIVLIVLKDSSFHYLVHSDRICAVSSSLFCIHGLLHLCSLSIMGINALYSKIFPIHYCRGAGVRVFYSAAISKRHEASILEAIDGIVITVSGFINRSRTLENGFPPKVCTQTIVLISPNFMFLTRY